MTKNILYFQGVGMDFHGKEQTEFSDIGNFRIKTSFLNNEGEQIYLEMMSGYIYNKKRQLTRMSLYIDFCFLVPKKGEEIEYNKIYDRKKDYAKTKELDYTKEDITKWINKNLNCNFDTIEVLNNFHGYHVHGEGGEYNLMEDVKINHELAKRREKAYNEYKNSMGKVLNRKHVAISIRELKDDYMILDNHQGRELLRKHGLTSRYETIIV